MVSGLPRPVTSTPRECVSVWRSANNVKGSAGQYAFVSQAQLIPYKRSDTVRPPHGQRSDSWIVILYIGDIRYQSGEGRLSDEDVDQLGKEPVAEDKLASPAIVSVSAAKVKACINIVIHAFVDFLKPYDDGGSTRLIPICSTRLSLWKNAQSTFGLSG